MKRAATDRGSRWQPANWDPQREDKTQANQSVKQKTFNRGRFRFYDRLATRGALAIVRAGGAPAL